jgi:hypothetical protein
MGSSRSAGYAREISSQLVFRLVLATVVVVLVGVWLHLWWLAVVYAGFWGFMVVRGQRRDSRR